MSQDYFSLLVIYPREDNDYLNLLFMDAGMIGSEIIDPKTIEEYQKRAAEWELSNREELLRVQEKDLGQEITEGFMAQRMYFLTDKKSLAKLDRAERQVYEQYGETIQVIEEGIIDNSHWNETWRSFYKPLEVGRTIRILPAWMEEEGEGRVIIKIDPGMAFGSGSHETTLVSLEFLEEMDLKNKAFLDLGTGSGILAIYAAMQGADPVEGTDIDPDAIRTAQKNAGIQDENLDIHFYVSDLLDRVEGSFDVVAANLLYPLLVRLLPDFHRILRPGAKIIFSGLLADQAEAIRSQACDLGYQVLETRIKGEWAGLVLEWKGQA